MFPSRHCRSRVVLVSLVFLSLASALPAYIDELNEEQVGEAYTLGQRHDQDVAKFFKAYEKTFPSMAGTLRVSRLAIRTPYYSVVFNSFERGSIYPMSQARTDYAAHPYPFLAVVTVNIPFANQFSVDEISKPESRFWQQFRIGLTENAFIAPRHMKSYPLYSVGTNYSSITGAEMLLNYDVRDVASRPVTVTVTGPDGQPLSAEFDLDSLK